MNRPSHSSNTLIESAPPNGFIAAWRWWIVPMALSLVLALLYIDPFVGDWDALDYTILSLRGQPSSMALGRSLFIFLNHALWRSAHALFQLRPEDAYLLFKGAVVVMSALATAACWVLARDLTNSVKTATVAALLVACSPSYVIYSGQVMTEIPSLLLLALALIATLRGWKQRRAWMILLGAALLGADVNMRETAAFYAPWIVVAPFALYGRKKLKAQDVFIILLAALVFLLFAFGPFIYFFLADTGGYRTAWYGWRETMREEAARHPISPRNALPFLIYFFLTSPLIFVSLPVAFFREWRERKFSPTLALAATGLFANLLLFLNYSTTINWRYFLTGLPALAPLCAAYFMRAQTARTESSRRAFVEIVAGIIFVTVIMGLFLQPSRSKFIEKRALVKSYRERLALLPPDAVVMAGGQSVAVTYWRGIGFGKWDIIGTGAGWPGGAGLSLLIESYLKDGRRVFVDLDRDLWSPCGWQREETTELVKIESRFRFRRVSDTIFEIRPVEDQTAADAPHMESLLPENRPADVERCAAVNKLS